MILLIERDVGGIDDDAGRQLLGPGVKGYGSPDQRYYRMGNIDANKVHGKAVPAADATPYPTTLSGLLPSFSSRESRANSFRRMPRRRAAALT